MAGKDLPHEVERHIATFDGREQARRDAIRAMDAAPYLTPDWPSPLVTRVIASALEKIPIKEQEQVVVRQIEGVRELRFGWDRYERALFWRQESDRGKLDTWSAAAIAPLVHKRVVVNAIRGVPFVVSMLLLGGYFRQSETFAVQAVAVTKKGGGVVLDGALAPLPKSFERLLAGKDAPDDVMAAVVRRAIGAPAHGDEDARWVVEAIEAAEDEEPLEVVVNAIRCTVRVERRNDSVMVSLVPDRVWLPDPSARKLRMFLAAPRLTAATGDLTLVTRLCLDAINSLRPFGLDILLVRAGTTVYIHDRIIPWGSVLDAAAVVYPYLVDRAKSAARLIPIPIVYVQDGRRRVCHIRPVSMGGQDLHTSLEHVAEHVEGFSVLPPSAETECRKVFGRWNCFTPEFQPFQPTNVQVASDVGKKYICFVWDATASSDGGLKQHSVGYSPLSLVGWRDGSPVFDAVKAGGVRQVRQIRNSPRRGRKSSRRRRQ